MSNYPSQDQPSWAGQSPRDDSYGRGSRDSEYGSAPRRSRQQTDMQNNRSDEGTYRSNRNQPWPRNEDRENYSAAPEYGRPDQYFEDGAASGPNRPYPAPREFSQSYGGPNANLQQPSRWRDNRSQHQAFNEYQNRFNQNEYGMPGSSTPQYGAGQVGLDQPGFFQAGDFSQHAGYTRSEYPENNYLRSGHHSQDWHPMDYAGRTQPPQNWQEREGAQRGAFGLKSTHRGRGPQGYTRSDERIKEDICERLSEHHYIDASQVRVEVSQGVVTLEGSVDDRWQKYQTEDLVDATSGVNDIHNRLSVLRAPRPAAQWTPQTTATVNATAAQNATGATSQGAPQSGSRKAAEKSEQNERGKPGFTGN